MRDVGRLITRVGEKFLRDEAAPLLPLLTISQFFLLKPTKFLRGWGVGMAVPARVCETFFAWFKNLLLQAKLSLNLRFLKCDRFVTCLEFS